MASYGFVFKRGEEGERKLGEGNSRMEKGGREEKHPFFQIRKGQRTGKAS